MILLQLAHSIQYLWRYLSAAKTLLHSVQVKLEQSEVLCDSYPLIARAVGPNLSP